MDCPYCALRTDSVLDQCSCHSVVDALLQDYTPFHTEFQIRHLILIRSGGTLWGCYQQSLREIAARCSCPRNEIVEGTHQSKVPTNTHIESLHSTLRRRVADEQQRELAVFIAYAIVLKAVLGPVSNQTRAELDRELWVYRIRAVLARDYICVGHPCPETIEMIHVLPHDMRAEYMCVFTNPDMRDRLIGWYLDYRLELPIPSPQLIQHLQIEFQKGTVLAEGFFDECDLSKRRDNSNAILV